MKCACAWCGKRLPDVSADNLPEDATTHGICFDCGNQLMSKSGTPLNDFLERLGVPVGVVNNDGRLEWAGTALCTLVGKEPDDVGGKLGGEVFECVHAREPGGCGRTVHCSGCTIRQSIMTTFETGESCLRVPAVLKAHRLGETPDIKLFVTTQQVDNVVLLRIDPVSTDTEEWSSLHQELQEV